MVDAPDGGTTIVATSGELSRDASGNALGPRPPSVYVPVCSARLSAPERRTGIAVGCPKSLCGSGDVAHCRRCYVFRGWSSVSPSLSAHNCWNEQRRRKPGSDGVSLLGRAVFYA